MSRVFLPFVVFFLLLASCSQEAQPLPRALYYLDGEDEMAQVWRLERDGVTRKQISFEDVGVDDFAVSPVDGTVALVSNNSLILVNARGKNRRLIVEAQRDTSQESHYRNTVSSPAFSPDGRTLAYGLNGIHLYDLSTKNDIHALTNPEPESDDALGYAKGVYRPASWSPDGSRLLILMSYYEGYLLEVMNPSTLVSIVQLSSEGAVCCLFTWTADAQSILAAAPYFTGSLPGLWRFDAQTGEQTFAIPGHDEDGFTNFVGWPFQSVAGELTYFQARLENFPIADRILFDLVRADKNGLNLQTLRPEKFSIRTALWSPDGAFVLVVGSWADEVNHLALVRPGTEEIKVLIEDASHIGNLEWGP